MPSPTIRPVKGEDREQLRNLMLQYIVDFYHYPQPSDESLNDLIDRLIEDPSAGIQYVAQSDEGTLLGFATLYFAFNTLEVKRMAILHDLFVTPAARGQKVGEALFATCVRHVRVNNLSHMTWETEHDNFTAQALYDKMGGKRQLWLNYEIK